MRYKLPIDRTAVRQIQTGLLFPAKKAGRGLPLQLLGDSERVQNDHRTGGHQTPGSPFGRDNVLAWPAADGTLNEHALNTENQREDSGRQEKGTPH